MRRRPIAQGPDRLAASPRPARGPARAAWALVVTAAGCHPAPPAAPPPPPPPAPCARAADSMVLAMLTRLPRGGEPTEQADALRNLIRTRCEADRWPAEATRCLIAMKQLADAEPCAQLLTDDQQAALVRDEQAWASSSVAPPR